MDRPWEKGITDQSKSFVIEVHVREDSKGTHSSRNLQDDVDEQTVTKLPNGGLEHASFGLIQEAMRQEALFQALILLTNGKDLSPDLLKTSLEHTFTSMLEKLSDSVVNSTIEYVSHRNREKTS